MKPVVVQRREDFEVLAPIIRTVPVDVVDMLIGTEVAPKGALDDSPVEGDGRPVPTADVPAVGSSIME
jgi:hypothetical protein